MNSTGIQDIYGLTPLQQGMLYHSVEAEGAALYLVTVLYDLRGTVDLIAFRSAWEKLLEDHPLLRTSFHWEDLDEPHQVVHAWAHLPFAFEDWRDLSANERMESLYELLEEDRTREFDLSVPPLLRLSLIRWEDDHFKLVLTHHHLLLDGWCRPVIFGQLLANYRAFLQHHEPPRFEHRAFRDYVHWVHSRNLTDAERFWRKELEGFTIATPLGVDRLGGSSGALQYRITTHQLRLSREMTKTLTEFCRAERVTPNTLLQGAWALLLSRYSGTDDVVFGAINAARPPDLEGIEDTVGPFINTLPVRARISPDVAMGDWLRGLQTRQAEARQYSYTPLAEIHRWSDVPAGMPLFETILVFLNLQADDEQHARGDFELRFVEHVTRTNFPLYLEARPGPEMSLTLTHDAARIDDAIANEMLGRLSTLLDRMMVSADRRLDELYALGEDELRRIVYEWNDTQREFPSARCVHELIEEQARRTPNATAVMDVEAELSYGALDRHANRLAQHLRGLGVTLESMVGICMDRSVDLMVALLGILKAGATFVPMDPDYPLDRLAYMAKDAGITTLVTHNDLDAGLAEKGIRVVRLDADAATISNCSDENPRTTCPPDSLAYLIYTSGSTGNPKGVMVPHRCVVNLLHYVADTVPLRLQDRFLAITSLSFDIAALELFAPLIAGARVLIADRELILDPPRLLAWLDEQAATVVQATPVMWELLLDAGGDESRRMTALCGGERMNRKLARRLLAAIDGRVLNMYGPTETTIWSTMQQIESSDSSPPIGRPIANTRAYILDDRLNPVPVGIAGQLYLGGSGVVRGYHGRPGLTAERFLPDPYALEAGGRMYATGDVVRHLPNGVIQFEGRADQQIKLRGMRIELEEIEAWLDRHPEVRDNVVALQAETPGEHRLVAYIVPIPEAAASAGRSSDELMRRLRDYLQQKLPTNMIPSVFVPLEELPLTPNRKVDRKSLPAPAAAARTSSGRRDLPESRLETTIAEAWKDILHIDEVSINDNFFDLGGSSLLAMRTVLVLERETGVRLSPRELVFQTLAQLAGVIESRQHPEHAA